MPRPLSYFGTEPFWAISFGIPGTEWSSLDAPRPRALSVLEQDGAERGYFVTLEDGPMLNHRAIIARLSCSDGMSDRCYGFSITRFTSAPDRIEIERGCRTLDYR